MAYIAARKRGGERKDNVSETAKLHVYDSEGNHLGENEIGGIDFQIEGGAYSPLVRMDNQSIGAETSVFYGEDDYIFVIEGIEDGLIDFEYKQSGNIIGETFISYLNVPTMNGSIAKTYIFEDHIDTTMYIDDDGDGIIDREIQPNNIITIDVPNVPIRPAGQVNGDIGKDYVYTTVSSDPEEDQLFYLFDWGDGSDSGWLGPFDSGVEVETFHNWTIKGDYEIKVKAKDVYDYESDWSDPLPVTMPRNKLVNRPFLNFLQQHPILYQLLLRFLQL